MREEVDTSTCCASCGIAECDDIKLKKCTACKSVRYCGVKCQREHRPRHKRDCKKRAAELRDELLFKQPECTYPGDCPICMIPMRLDVRYSTMMMCCSKIICCGCSHADSIRKMQDKSNLKCPFCRKPVPTDEEAARYTMKRIEADDPVAMRHQGTVCYNKGEHSRAFEYWAKAAGLGDVEAHCKLAGCYSLGRGVVKDKKKEIHHVEEAAIAGHPDARYNLGVMEWNNGKIERAVKHFIITATQGHDGAIEVLRRVYAEGAISKENFAAALRAHQTAVDATKSPQREAAEEYHRSRDKIHAEDC